MTVAASPRTFTHRDGRRWAIAVDGRTLILEITLPDDPESILRRPSFRDGAEAARAAVRLIEEQLADGFEETTPRGEPPPPEPDPLDELARLWHAEDPSFDRWTELWAPIERLAREDRELVERSLKHLDFRWPTMGPADPNREFGLACAFFSKLPARRADALPCDATHYQLQIEQGTLEQAESLPARPDLAAAKDAALLLALRSTRSIVADNAHDLLGHRFARAAQRTPALDIDTVLGALLSLLETKRPATVLGELSLPPAAVERLIAATRHEHWEIAYAAVLVLAPLAMSRAVFEAVWATRSRGDVFELPVMRACEAARDPATIPWLEKLSRRSRGPGWKALVLETIDVVAGRAQRR